MSQPNASPMGQILLGFRSLAVKIAVFVVLASLLAWILGGTLWPRPVIRLVGEPVGSYQLVVISTEEPQAHFGLALIDERGKPMIVEPKEGEPKWRYAFLQATDDDGFTVVYAMEGGRWGMFGSEFDEPTEFENEAAFMDFVFQVAN